MASNNSLPTMTIGRSGRLGDGLVPDDALSRNRRASSFAPRSDAGLSRPWRSWRLAANAGSSLSRVRSMSFISVPRPGPISASVTGSGRPIACQALEHPHADQLAEHLADLRRGGEVACCAERLARRVIAVIGIEQANRHVVGDGQRAVRLDQFRDLLPEPRQNGSGAGGCSRRLGRCHRPDADQHHRRRQHHAHGQPAAQEIADLLVRLAEELNEDARQPVAGDEGAADETGEPSFR